MKEAGGLIALLFAAALDLDAGTANATVEISTRPTANMTCSGGVCTPTAKKAVLNVTDLAGMLASGDVTITSGSLAQDIEINAALSWTSTSRLTLDAYHSIIFNASVVVAGTGAITIATNDGGTDGDYRFLKKGHIEFWDLQSDLTINDHKYRLFNTLKTFRAAIQNSAGRGMYLAQAKNWSTEKTFAASPIDGFEGMLDGLGNKISNLKIEQRQGDNNHVIGLFASVMSQGEIRDVTLVNVQITVNGAVASAGTLAAANFGTIRDSHASGQISGGISQSYLGGLVGGNVGTISNCSAHVAITGIDAIGGAGGLVGLNQAFFPGFPGIIQMSYSSSAVSGGGSVGGLVGETDGGTITNSYSTGPLTATNGTAVGGLIGIYAVEDTATPTLTASYSMGVVSGGNTTSVGGLLGEDLAHTSISNSYWDLDTSTISDPSKGAGNIANDPGITGLSDAQLTSGLPAGFDKKVWKQSAAINNGYPYLIDNPPR